LLWSFVSGHEPKVTNTALKWVIGVVIVIAVILALLWAMGVEQGVFGWISNALFGQTWSADLWTNIAFIVVIIIALVLVLTGAKDK
jgi:hypothetical protein